MTFTQNIGLLWTRDHPVAETSNCQLTALARDRHAFPLGGIRTSNPSKRAVAEICLRARDCWERPKKFYHLLEVQSHNTNNIGVSKMLQD